MTQREKELEDVIKQVEAKLLSPPNEVEQLLDLLDETEELLSRIEQSPTRSMLDALDSTIKSFVGKELFQHSDLDVKVAVASCISEITRITAPEAPYDDALMKEVFQRIVETFEKLDEKSSRSYSKRVTILETLAKVRSCVVMLDLECDALVLEMFQHFLRISRSECSENVFLSMETIMILVLEESEDISPELLSCLLNCLKKDNEDSSHNLAEKVVRNCAVKLRPCLLDLFQLPDSLSGYDDIVASIWRGTWEQTELNTSDHLADENKLSERTVSEELAQGLEMQEPEVGYPVEVTEKPQTSVLTNGSLPKGDGDAMIESKAEEPQPDFSHPTVPLKDATVSDSKLDKMESGIGIPASTLNNGAKKKKKGKKSGPAVLLTEIAGQSQKPVDDDSALPLGKKYRAKEASVSLFEGAKVAESSTACLDENEVQLPLSSENGGGFPSENAPDGGPRRRGRPPGSKNSLGTPRRYKRHDSKSSPKSSPLKHESENVSMSEDGKASKRTHVKKHIDGASDSEGAAKYSPKKICAEKDEDGGAPVAHVHSKSQVKGRGSGKRGMLKGVKGIRGRTPDGVSSGEQKFETRKRKREVKDDDIADEGMSLKEMVSLPRSAIKVQQKEILHSGESAHAKSRRKRASNAEEDHQELDESLVGCKIEVWWPDDKKYYAGVVDSYFEDTKRHKIIYDDGDVEVLRLKEESWRTVDAVGHSASVQDLAHPEPSPKVHRIRKGKTNSGIPMRRSSSDKSGSARKRRSRASGGKVSSNKKDVSKSRGRPKGGSPVAGTPDVLNHSHEKPLPALHEGSSGSGNKPKEDTVNKPNDDSMAQGSRSKDENHKGGRKQRSASTKPGSKIVDGGSKISNKQKDGESETAPKSGRKGRAFSSLPSSAGATASDANGASEKGKSKTNESETPGSRTRSETTEKADTENVSASTGRKRRRKAPR